MGSEIKEILDDYGSRLKKIEDILFSQEKMIKPTKKDYKGLAGGIRFLIDNGFFKQPKTLIEIRNELKREGYLNTMAGVASTLSRTFTMSQKVLNRVKEDKVWKYVVRK